MTPQEFMEQISSFSKCDDPDGLLNFAESHLAEVLPDLSTDKARRVNELGHWASMVVSLREFSEREAVDANED